MHTHNNQNNAHQPTAQDVSQAGFLSWLENHQAQARPRHIRSALAHWNATASGSPEAYSELSDATLDANRLYLSREDFLYLQQVKQAGVVTDPKLVRQLQLLYNEYLSNQFDEKLMEEIVKLSSHLGEQFNLYRVRVNGEVLSDNQVEHVLHHSTDVTYRKQVWEASKGIGEVVAHDLKRLVKLRNQAARQLGYENYYVLSLEMGEQKEHELFALLEDMALHTDKPFFQVKARLDAHLAHRFGIQVSELRPWHYGDRFFQETPSVGTVDLDSSYEEHDVVELAARFYDALGLPARQVIARSDLEGRAGKYQHAYCTDIDRAGDVRVMCSVSPSEHWMDTMLHELGHAVYDLGIAENAELPYVLRAPAHTFTTEGIANLMGRFSANTTWMKHFVGLSEQQARELEPRLRERTCTGALIFARWCMVMAHFERELYRDPDQDLTGLWYSLVQRFQGLTRPEGRTEADWATKIHLVASPVYYHNYLLGDLYAAQLHDAIARRFYPGQDPWTVVYADRPEVGQFLQEAVFRPGAIWRWDRLVEESTGEPLSARAYARTYMHETASA